MYKVGIDCSDGEEQWVDEEEEEEMAEEPETSKKPSKSKQNSKSGPTDEDVIAGTDLRTQHPSRPNLIGLPPQSSDWTTTMTTKWTRGWANGCTWAA